MKNNTSETTQLWKRPQSLNQYAFVIVIVAIWTLLIIGLGLWDARREMQDQRELVRNEARAHFLKDQAFRFWAAGHGGVYVPPTEHTPPSPHLSHIPDRDIETADGKKLTLMNPAYMVRQLMEDFEKLYGIRGRITSLKPLRPENAPDEWEQVALESFEKGAGEANEFTETDGEPYLRLMRPMMVRKSCLKCHGHQGYKNGDIRGGVGVSVPAAKFFARARREIVNHSFTLGLLWLIGIAGVALGTSRIWHYVRERNRAEEALSIQKQEFVALMQTVIDGFPESLMVINRDYTIALANRTVREMAWGRDPVAACLKCHQVSHKSAMPCEGTEDPCPLEQVVATKAQVTVEHIHHDTEGRAVSVEVIAAPILDKEGEVIQIIESCRNITDRKRVEQALRESEADMRSFMENALNFGVYQVKLVNDEPYGTQTSFASPSIKSILGVENPQDNAAWFKNIHADDLDRVTAAHHASRTTGKKFDEIFQNYHTSKQEWRWIHAVSSAVIASDGTFTHFNGLILDVTDARQAEEVRTLHLHFLENMERVDRVIRKATDLDQMMSDVLQTMLEMFGTDRAWLLYPCDPEAESWSVPMERTQPEYPGAFVLEEDIPMVSELADTFREALDKGDVITIDSRNPTKANETAERFSILAEMYTPLHPQTGKPWLFGMHQCSYHRGWTDKEKDLFREISRRLGDALGSLLFLRELRASEERWRSLTIHSPDHVMLLDCDGTVRFINHAVPGLSVEQVLGTSVHDHVPEDFRQTAADCFRQVASSRQIGMYETNYHTDDGDLRHFEVRVAPVLDKGEAVALISNSHDITERKQAEEMLIKKQHLNELLLNSIPHPAMLINTDRIVRAANKIAFDTGVKLGDYCWKGFGKCEYLSDENKKRAEENPDDERIKCTFCLADEAMKGAELKIMNAPEVCAFDKIWDIYWDPIDKKTFFHYAIDITEHKQAEKALRMSEEKYRLLTESMKDVVIWLSPVGKILYVSPAVREFGGYDPESEIGNHMSKYFEKKTDIIRATKLLEKVLTTRQGGRFEFLFKPKNKKPFHAEHTYIPILKNDKVAAIQIMLRDITDRRQAEERIRASLQEKEVLLQEIHHRVKNNLAIISSLLSFQAEITPDEQVRTAFQESRNRILAMARIHEHLYQSPDLAQIDMAQYVRGMVSQLRQSYGADAIALRVNVSDVTLDIDRATPCGLIINELISNIFKHAFPADWRRPENQPDQVCVDLRSDDDGQCILTVSDNGIGLPADLQIESVGRESLGLRLVNLLSRQLEGTLQTHREGGSTFCLTFPIPEERSDDDE